MMFKFLTGYKWFPCIVLYILYGDEMWRKDKEIYNPNGRKTEIKIGAK
jgi:hypothetical protein